MLRDFPDRYAFPAPLCPPLSTPLKSAAASCGHLLTNFGLLVLLWVGPGARNEQGQIVALDVREGDRILFGKWSGTEVKIDGEELLIMKESDIMGIVEGTPAGNRKAA
jgi:Chaperonin 10 Kd subunit